MDKYWTTGDVLKRFKIARATLGRWRRRLGFPRAIHFGGHTRTPAYYLVDEVLAWETAHTKRP
jgi:hypothetical protein